MSIHKYIKENITRLGSNSYAAPHIPEKRLNGALTTYAQNVNLEHVIAIKDSSILSSGKEGCLFIGDSVFVRGPFGNSLQLEYESIEKIEYYTIEKETKFKKTKTVGKVRVLLKNEETIDVTPNLVNVNLKGFVELIQGILKEGEEGKEFVNTSQVTPLSEMSEDIKVNYLKLVANFTYSDDEKIDAREYAEIISLISRIDLSPPKRIEIRSYISNTESLESHTVLLNHLRNNVEEGSFNILSKSLFKDILYIFGKNNDIHAWSKNKFLSELSETLDIAEKEIELIITAIKNDEAILKERKNDSEIKKTMKDIAAKAAAVGLPMATIYFSGSVVGLSAAGITSGLATMGMGGILGFSSMFTGIGAIVLLGVGTYQGLKKITGINDLENNKQREFMLQAIIRNTQKSLSYLIEDINEITRQLSLEIKKGNENSVKIEKLSDMLNMLTQGAKINSLKQQKSQIEQIITTLPLTLDVNRLYELTTKPTLEKVRQFILSCYVSLPAVVTDNEKTSANDEFGIKEDLTLDEAEGLHECFQKIEYNKVAQAAFATVTGKAKNYFNNR